MKRRLSPGNNSRLQNNKRRRQLLKRVHQKILLRRQQFQIMELNQDGQETS